MFSSAKTNEIFVTGTRYKRSLIRREMNVADGMFMVETQEHQSVIMQLCLYNVRQLSSRALYYKESNNRIKKVKINGMSDIFPFVFL